MSIRTFLGHPPQSIKQYIIDKNQHLIPLTFTAEEAESTVMMSKSGAAPEVSLQYSRDNKNWEEFIIDETTLTLDNVGDKVYLRAGSEGNSQFANQPTAYNYFIMTGKLVVTGNIMSLLNQDFENLNNISNGYWFLNLFANCTSLISAKNLKLPATTLSPYCYSGIFSGCSSLSDAPKLPATTLAKDCYSSMFVNCSSLTVAPELPATNLNVYCYSNMFSSCSSLSTAPELPATTLNDWCYQYMFQNCSSLTATPKLPATEITNYCYQYMFKNCSKLNEVNVSFTKWTSIDATKNWLSGVASTGTFYSPGTLSDERGVDYIPEGWTRVIVVSPK